MTGFFEELSDSNIDSMEIKIKELQNKLKKLLPTGMNIQAVLLWEHAIQMR